MKNIWLLSLLVIFISFEIVCSFSSRAHPCVQSRSCHSHDFEVAGTSDSQEEVNLSFAVKMNNVDKLFQTVNDVSNPQSPNYGKHWSFEKLEELTSNQQAKSNVLSHLLKFVEPSQIVTSHFSSLVQVKTNLKTAEKILKTKYHKFKSVETGEVVSRTLEFEVPFDVSESVDYIFPTVQFPTTYGKRAFVLSEKEDVHSQTSRGLKLIKGSMTPNSLKSYYNITSNIVNNPLVTQSVYSSGGQSFAPADLAAFQRTFKLQKHPVDKIIGPNNPSSCSSDASSCLEASLDVQYVTSVAQMASTTFWSTPVNNFADWITQVASTPNPPLVLSISYGQYETQTDDSEQQRFAQEAAKLGAQGVTIVVATGDDGVSMYGARTNPLLCSFNIPYPANIPYVLSVGATMGPETGSPEVACESDRGSAITTGGGFSTVFERPSYQSSQVDNFLVNAERENVVLPAQPPYFPTSTMFNSSGRAIPDVSIAGNNYQIVIGASSYQVSGTSASAPVFAAILSLANNARLNLGKSALGFVNPLLYQLSVSQPSIFNDITSGNNRCTAINNQGVGLVCCQHGFSCAQGWDPVTGLGSVNVGRLIEALKNM